MPSQGLVICVKLGGEEEIEARVDPDLPAEVAQRICDAVQLLQQRIVSEEDAEEAMKFLEEVASAEKSHGSCSRVAHLCLAEAYISGAIPQYGRDHRRAFKAIVAFLQSISSNHGYDDLSPHIMNSFSRISTELSGIDVARHADALLNIAEHVHGIEGVALRACLYKPQLNQVESGTLMLKTGKPIPEEALLESILSQLRKADQDKTALHAGARKLQEELMHVAGALQGEQEKSRLLEEMVNQSTDTNQQLKSINSELSHRLVQSEAMVVALHDELEHHKLQAHEGLCASEELRRENRHLREEIAGREKALVHVQEHLERELEAQSCETDHLHRQLAQKGELCRELEAKLQDERAAQIEHFEHPHESQLPPISKDRHWARREENPFDCEGVLSQLLKRQTQDKTYEGYNQEVLEEAAKQAALIFKEAGHSRSQNARATASTSTTRSATPRSATPPIGTYDVDVH
jgi:hypothetical protein